MVALSRCWLLLVGFSLLLSCEEKGEAVPKPVKAEVPAPPKPVSPPAPWFSGRWEGAAGPARVTVVLRDTGEVSEGSLTSPGAREPLVAVGVFDEASSELRLRFRAPEHTGFGVLRQTAAGDAFSGSLTWSVASPKWAAHTATVVLDKVGAR